MDVIPAVSTVLRLHNEILIPSILKGQAHLSTTPSVLVIVRALGKHFLWWVNISWACVANECVYIEFDWVMWILCCESSAVLVQCSEFYFSFSFQLGRDQNFHYTTGWEIITKKFENSQALRKAYEDLDSTIVILIFYWLNGIIIFQRFTMVAEFQE